MLLRVPFRFFSLMIAALLLISSCKDEPDPQPDLPRMVAIPGGSFTMGSDLYFSQPPHAVSVEAFYMGETEVTQAQWKSVMGTNPSWFQQPAYPDCPDCPVEQVSWNDIQLFLAALNSQTGQNYRLPTEAEWEYAARSGQLFEYAGSGNIDAVVWYGTNSGGKPHSVKTKLSNAWGLYDMSGNVSEWCEDWLVSYPGHPTPFNYTGTSRVRRGGSWFNDGFCCRVANRIYDDPSVRSYDLGFRLARQF